MAQISTNQWRHLSSKNGDLPVPPIDREQTFCMVIDIDQDGIDEIVLGGRNQSPALVYLKPDTDGWKTFIIDDSDVRIEAGGAFFDIDGDGYPDIVAGGDWMSNQLFWWKNPGRQGKNEVWKRYEIMSAGNNQYHDQIFGDFDGDGKAELVFWNQGDRTLYLSTIPDDPTIEPWPCEAIYKDSASNQFPYEGLAKGDIDGDGTDELLAGGMWFKCTGHQRFTPYMIEPQIRDPRIQVGDFDQDGQLEVIMVSADHQGSLLYYKCDGDPRYTENWKRKDLLGIEVNHGHSLQVADFDGDGHLDILCAEMRQWSGKDDHPEAKMWLLYGNGKGDFKIEEMATGFCVHEAKIGDFTGDGKLDIATKPYVWESNRIDVWINQSRKK